MLTLKKQLSTKTNKPYLCLGIYVEGEFIPLTFDKNTILLYVLAKGQSIPDACGEYQI